MAALDFAYARIVGTVLGVVTQKIPPEELQAHLDAIDPDQLCRWSFRLADAFVDHSRGTWAELERTGTRIDPMTRRHRGS